MVLLESGENYLETILILQQRNGNVRSIDIATEMNFSKPRHPECSPGYRGKRCLPHRTHHQSGHLCGH